MLSPIYYENCTEAILTEYARLEDAILSAMIRRILKMGFVSDSTKHQAEMLQNAGLLYNDIIDIIAQHTNATKNQVKTLFEDAGVETVDIDNEVYREAGNVPVDIRQSDSMRQVLEAGFRKTMGIMDNLTKTTAVTTQQMFYEACNDAYMQITSGAFSYSEAVRNAIRRAAQGGLTVKYPTGHTDKLDVAVRRAALTGVGQTCAEIGKMNAEEMGCYLMEISAHSGARPEHAKWQGQLVTLTGQDAGKIIDGMKVFTLHKIGYGTGAGFRGWNCRHDWYPYFPGISVPNYSKQELEKLNARDIEWNGEKYTEYEITQMQRAQERKIRELKRQTVKMQDAADFATDPKLKELAKADHQVMSVKLKAAEQDLKRFCNATGQDRDRFREQVLGFGRSQAQRAVQSNNAHFRNSMKEKGFENPPKSLAKFEEMRYNNPKEYELMNTYLKSVDTGMMSPLVGYEKYKEYHDRVETELIGITTSNGVTVKSQSKHFLERVFGTISDPSHGNRPRTGVELEKIADALKNGSVRQHKNGSYVYHTEECAVSVNPDTGNLIQVTPQ